MPLAFSPPKQPPAYDKVLAGYLMTQGSVSMDAVRVMTDLRAFAIPSQDGFPVLLLGCYLAGDYGGGLFVWDQASTASDNGGTIIKPASAPSTGRWRRAEGTQFTARQFGAKGDGAAIDTPFLQQTIANRGIIANGNYLVDQPLVLHCNTRILGINQNTVTLKAAPGYDGDI